MPLANTVKLGNMKWENRSNHSGKSSIRQSREPTRKKS